MEEWAGMTKSEYERLMKFALRAVLKNSIDYIFIKDKNAVCRAASDSFLHLLQRMPADVYGHPDSEFFAKELADHYRSDDLKVLHGGKSIIGEIEKTATADGGEQWGHTQKFPIQDEKGGIIGLVGISSDFTEQRELEKKANDARKEEDLLNNVPFGCGIFHFEDTHFCVDMTNDGLYLIPYLTPDYMSAFKGRNFAGLLYRPDLSVLHAEYSRVKDLPGETGSVDYRVYGADGKLHWLNSKFRRAYISNGIQYYYITYDDVDRQKQSEQEMLTIRHMYDNAAMEAKLVIWNYDIEKHEVTIPQAGYTGEICKKLHIEPVIENAPESLVTYVDPRDVNAFLDTYRKIDNGASYARCDFRFQLPGQNIQKVERMSLRRIEDENGNLITVHCCGQNITAQRNGEERYLKARLQLEEAHPKTLGSFHLNLTQNWCGEGRSSIDFVLKQQESGTVDGYFAECSKLIADDTVAKQFFAKFDRQKLIAEFKKGHTYASLQFPTVSKNGSRHWREGELYMLQNPSTGDIEAVTYGIDIDDQKINELIAEKLISENFDYIGLINPLDGTIEIRVGQASSVIPPESRKSYSYAKAWNAIADMIAPGDREKYIASVGLNTVLESLRSTGHYSFSYRRTAGGQALLRNVSYTWLENPDGLILIVATDITAAYQHEQDQLRQISEALLEANRANESKSSFLSSMSHDLRTPLNGILGFTGIALNESDLSTKQKYLERIKASGDLLLDLVNDTLDLSRIESGKMQLNPESIKGRELLASVIAAISPAAEQKGVKLVLDMDQVPDRPVYIDRLKHEKIALNLISNAVKFTPPGGSVRVTLRDVSIPGGGHRCRFAVEDNGIGMSEEFQKRLFEPFAQEKRPESANVTGTGLGLSIVKRIVDLLGGTIQAESAIGKGTRFTVELPIQEAMEKAALRNEQHTEISLRNRTVLLCEDNTMNIEIAQIILKEQGIAVECALNGKEGLLRFAESPEGYYDAVLMDIRMPEMDGYEAARAIRALSRADARTVPIIAMTADAFEESIRAADEAGMDSYITKPIEPRRLLSALQAAIQYRKQAAV